MASFTDAITQFNPYIQQLPVDEMMQVGMYKQAKYDEGLQKVQSYVDNIAGIDVIKPEHKQYLQSKVNELGGKLRSVAAGDFSNQQLVNSVGGMTSQVIKDPKIQNYVSSTQQIRKMLEDRDADKKAGKSSPANEKVFEMDLNNWLSDGKADSSFRGNYSQFFDIDKHVKEQFDAIKPGGWSSDMIWKTDPNTGQFVKQEVKDKSGKVTGYNLVLSESLKRTKNEGRLPSEVEGALKQIMNDPRVQNQLSINGRYQYMGVSGNQLNEALLENKDNFLDKKYDKMQHLGLLKSAGYNVQEDINKLQDEIDTSTVEYDNLAKKALEDPEGYKAKLYKDSAVTNYTSMYGGIRTSTEYHDNPEWSNNWKKIVEANNIKRHTEDMNLQWKMHEDTQRFTAEQNQLSRTNAMNMAMLKGKKGGMIDTNGDGIPDMAVGGGGGEAGMLEPSDTPSDMSLIDQIEIPYKQAGEKYSQIQDKFIWESLYGSMPDQVAKLNGIVERTPGITRDQAMGIMLNNAAKLAKVDPDKYKAALATKASAALNSMPINNKSIKDLKSQYDNAKRDFDDLSEEKEAMIKKAALSTGIDVRKYLSQNGINSSTAEYQGKQYKIDPQDWYDLAVYAKGHQSAIPLYDSLLLEDGVKRASSAAEQRIRAKGLDFMLDHVLEQTLTPLGVVTNLTRVLGAGLSKASQPIRRLFGAKETRPVVGQQRETNAFGIPTAPFKPSLDRDYFYKAYQGMDSELTNNVYKAMADHVKENLNYNSPMKQSILTGDNETDKYTLGNISRFTSRYAGRDANLSGDFDEFKESMATFDPKVNSLETQILPGQDGKPLVEIVLGDVRTGRKGGMIIGMEEAKNLGIDVSNIYEPQDVRMIKNKINRRGSTAKGPVNDIKAFYDNDVYLQTNNFKNYSAFGNDIDVKANFIGDNGLYYATIYAKKGNGIPVMHQTPGYTNLQQLVEATKTISPTEINKILSLSNK